MILTPLQKLPKNVEDLGKLIVARQNKVDFYCPIRQTKWEHPVHHA